MTKEQREEFYRELSWWSRVEASEADPLIMNVIKPRMEEIEEKFPGQIWIEAPVCGSSRLCSHIFLFFIEDIRLLFVEEGSSSTEPVYRIGFTIADGVVCSGIKKCEYECESLYSRLSEHFSKRLGEWSPELIDKELDYFVHEHLKLPR